MASEELGLHSAHPYPCKFPPKIVQQHLPAKGKVLDPYCGSGTTLLEAAYRGLDVFGVDCNPIAILITKCKLVDLSPIDLSLMRKAVEDIDHHSAELEKFGIPLHEFPGRDHWFSQEIQKEFSYVLSILGQYEKDSPEWVVLATALSAVTNRFSNQDSETRYAAVSKNYRPGEMLSTFLNKAGRIIASIEQRGPLKSSAVTFLGDIRNGIQLEPKSLDVIITSPPYANTMDYYLYHKQRMNILGFDFKETQRQEIGSRHQFSSRKDGVEAWNLDYHNALVKSLELLKPGGKAWVVIGDSQISGQLIDGGELTLSVAKELGLTGEIVESVPMTGKSRLFRSSFQSPNKFEHIVCITI